MSEEEEGLRGHTSLPLNMGVGGGVAGDAGARLAGFWGSPRDHVVWAMSQPLASSPLPRLSPKATANISHFFRHGEGAQRPTRCTTSLQGQEEVSVALQLLHELLVLQEERDPLVLQVLLPAALLVPGPGPGRGGQASLSVHGLGAPGVALRRGVSMLNA